MPAHLILWPVWALIVFTLLIYIRLVIMRSKVVSAREVDTGKVVHDGEAYPHPIRRVAHNLRNQFESPVLFYVLAFALWGLGAVSMISLTLAWLYVAARGLHAIIHQQTDRLPTRFYVFLISYAALIGLSIELARALIRIGN